MTATCLRACIQCHTCPGRWLMVPSSQNSSSSPLRELATKIASKTKTKKSTQVTAMADVRNPTGHQRPYSRLNPTNVNGSGGGNSLLRRLQTHAPNSSQLIGFLTLFVSGSILLLLIGLTVTATILGLIFFAPLLILSSPIWVPIGTILFVTIAGFLSFVGFGVAVLASLSWTYRYFKGMHPPGSDRVDYARSRIYDTASHVKDYAREYGGYLQSKVKDAAPGA